MVENTPGRARRIRTVIQAEERRLRACYGWLSRQDLLGASIFGACVLLLSGVAALYLAELIPWWLSIPLMALPLSILHELEHDLIHNLYFRSKAWIQHGMFFVIWFCKMSLNPWYRKQIHLRHHRDSGQRTDIEERLLGIGLRFGILRLFVALHPIGAILLFRRIKRDVPDFKPLRLALLSLPTFLPLLVILESYLHYLRVRNGWADWIACFGGLPDWGWPWARNLTVLLIAPNILRQSCLALISSYSHYYEDIPPSDVFYQTQVLRAWALLPFQIFCFNFGATHILHHFVVKQPFYLRQMVARAAYPELVRQGVRVNDLGSVRRANRWSMSPATISPRDVTCQG